MSAILLNVGAVSGICGMIWLMWDKYAIAPGWLCGVGLLALIVGGALS